MLARQGMPDPQTENEQHVERRVVYETVSASTTKSSAWTIGFVIAIALAIVIWIATKM